MENCGSGGLRKLPVGIPSSSSFCANCVWSKSGLRPPPVNQEQKGPVAIPQGRGSPAVLTDGLSWTPTYNDSPGVAGSSPGSPVGVPQFTAIPQVPTTAQGAAPVGDGEHGKSQSSCLTLRGCKDRQGQPLAGCDFGNSIYMIQFRISWDLQRSRVCPQHLQVSHPPPKRELFCPLVQSTPCLGICLF